MAACEARDEPDAGRKGGDVWDAIDSGVHQAGSLVLPCPADSCEEERTDGCWDQECSKVPCRQQRRALAELRAKDEKFGRWLLGSGV